MNQVGSRSSRRMAQDKDEGGGGGGREHGGLSSRLRSSFDVLNAHSYPDISHLGILHLQHGLFEEISFDLNIGVFVCNL